MKRLSFFCAATLFALGSAVLAQTQTTPANGTTVPLAQTAYTSAPSGSAGGPRSILITTVLASVLTNDGPATLRVSQIVGSNYVEYGGPAAGSNAPSLRRVRRPTSRWTDVTFDHFDSRSLNHLVWTNYLAHTNGAAALFTRQDRSAVPPAFTWNPRCWVWGSRGLTGCSPVSEVERWPGNAPGQIPITALTRRHGYTRGHSMGGGEGSTGMVGIKVWFYTTNNQPVERRIVAQQTRTQDLSGRDYTLVLFDADLPASISPLRVADTNYVSRYPWAAKSPRPLAIIEQSKTIQSGVPPFAADTRKGGDSGSPVMLPLPGELVFLSGMTTSEPSTAMQADMDELSRRAGLNPSAYQMQYIDLSRWPVWH